MKIKINKFKLYEQMEKQNMKREQLAQYMGISKQVLYRKIKDGFSVSEMAFIEDHLSLRCVDRDNLINTVK